MNSGYEFLTQKEEMWAKMLIEVISDNGIPYAARPINGAGFSIKTGQPDFLNIYVPSEYLKTASELVEELFNKPEPAEDADGIWDEMYSAANAVKRARKISEYVDAGGVAAAVRSKSGKIYTGVCIDTCCTLGICAERNAIFNMITNGESEIDKVLCIMPDGSTGAPCGACRELMVQIMAGKYQNIEIMLDYVTGKTVPLGEITPEWWIK